MAHATFLACLRNGMYTHCPLGESLHRVLVVTALKATPYDLTGEGS